MDEFVPVLRSVLRYEQGNQTVLATILVITLVVIGFFVIKSFPKMKHLDRIIVFMVVFSFTAIFILYLCHNNNYRNNLMTDINQESFVEFYGEFIHDDYQKDSFYHNIYIMDPSGEKILLHYPDYANMYDTYNDFRTLPVGSFVGTIVYGKESKIVVGWSIEQRQWDGSVDPETKGYIEKDNLILDKKYIPEGYEMQVSNSETYSVYE